MKLKSLTANHILIFFAAFWVTEVVIRFVIFDAFLHGKVPAVKIYGVHIHHFVFGFLLLAIAALVVYFRNIIILPLLVAGAGTSLIFDEFVYWTRLHFDYWSMKNLEATAILSFIIFLLYHYSQRKYLKTSLPKVPLYHGNPTAPLVSVVVPAYNEAKFLPRALDSLCKQQFQNFELIVVDNNSTDNTAAVAKAYGAKVISESRQGVGFARQMGFLAAQGQIIATTDADTMVPKDWLLRITQAFKRDKNLAAFGGLYKLYSGSWTAKVVFPYLIYYLWQWDKKILGGWILPGANMAISKTAFLEVGGFNTALNLGEDADISLRLKKIGNVVLDPKFLVTTSGRRYRHGLFRGILAYAPFILAKTIFKTDKFNRLPIVRKETPAWSIALLSLLLPILLLFTIFSLHNILVAKADQTRPNLSIARGVFGGGRQLAGLLVNQGKNYLAYHYGPIYARNTAYIKTHLPHFRRRS